jgi:hypothetical protein
MNQDWAEFIRSKLKPTCEQLYSFTTLVQHVLELGFTNYILFPPPPKRERERESAEEEIGNLPG